jgi:hypothetical protein
VYLFSGIFGGNLIGVRSTAGLSFYDWENTELVRRIEIQPKSVRKQQRLKYSYVFFKCSSKGELKILYFQLSRTLYQIYKPMVKFSS